MRKRNWFRQELERDQIVWAKKRHRRASKPAKVTRATVWRKKRSLKGDKKVLQKNGGVIYTKKPPGLPCHLCGQPRRKEFCHVTYKGKSFCSTASSQSASDWLAEQKLVDGSCRGGNDPRTTAWNIQKRQSKQKAEEFGITLKDRKRPGFYICNLCGQPRQKS